MAPHGLSVEGIFGVLANVVWTSQGPCHPDGFEAVRARLESFDRADADRDGRVTPEERRAARRAFRQQRG